MVRHALSEMVDWPSRLIAFSDDMDGMRKVPPGRAPSGHDARPSRPAAAAGCPIPLAAAMTAMRRTTTICSANSSTASASITNSSPRPIATGRAASTRPCGRCFAATATIMDVMLPTLGEERRRTYSPVLPISPESGKVLQVPVEVVDAEAGAGPLHRSGRPARRSSSRSSAAAPSCSGRSTGRCAGSRSASITRCRART